LIIDELSLGDLQVLSKRQYHLERFYFFCFLSKKKETEGDKNMAEMYRSMALREELESQKYKI